MVDPISTGLLVWGGKDITTKLLGPTADYLGKETKDLVEKGNQNIKKIFTHAIRILGPKLDQEGVVSPRVLRHIISEGAFCEDELSLEYFGGILASSRSGTMRDDRGVALTLLLSSMSTYQIRMHYIFYTIVRKLFKANDLAIGIHEVRKERMRIFIPENLYMECMDFSENENTRTITSHVICGLIRLALIDEEYASGDKERMYSFYIDAQEGGILLIPDMLGMELSYGRTVIQMLKAGNFLNSDLIFKESEHLIIPDGAVVIGSPDFEAARLSIQPVRGVTYKK